MKGHEKLWGWFGLSYASFVTMPRTLMHAMPDQWQSRMADLLKEFDAEFPGQFDMPTSYVVARRENRFVSWPAWLLNYRYPDRTEIQKLRRPQRRAG